MAKNKADLQKKHEERKAAGLVEADAAPEEYPKEFDVEDLDVFSVEDVLDIGNGEPLFFNFVYEDWTLLSTRYELHLLLHSFKKDLNDEDRPSFSEAHLAFYYQKYFRKTWNVKQFGSDKLETLIDMIKDTVSIGERGFLKTEQAVDAPAATFLKFTEDHRRDRQRRLDAGDETAKLKFLRPQPQPPKQPAPLEPKGEKGNTASQSKGSTAPSNGSSSRPTHGSGGGSSSHKRPYSSTSSAGGGYSSQPSKQSRSGSYGSSYGSSSYGGSYSRSYGR